MPGKRFKYTMNNGPWNGKDCRFLKNDARIPGHAIIETRAGETPSIPLVWIAPKAQKSTRSQREKKGRAA